MKWDVLLYWMAHVGHGSWASFKRAVANLEHHEDPRLTALRLRARFSDLGIAEFFVGGTARWQTFQTLVVASEHAPTETLLCGARTPEVLQRLKSASRAHGCQYIEVVPQDEPRFSNVKIVGSNAHRVASACNITFVPDIGTSLAPSLPRLSQLISTARREAIPSGWKTRAFDFRSRRWASSASDASVLEAVSPYEERRYYLRNDERQPLVLPKRIAIYAGAHLQRLRIAGYEAHTLWCDTSSPLPEAYARLACLAGTRTSVIRGERIAYEKVPPQLGTLILAALQQPRPDYYVVREPDNTKGRRQ